MRLLARITILLTLFVLCSVPGFTQVVRIEGPAPSAPAGAETFTSLEGRFTISLPRQISGFSPQSANTPEGRVEGSTFHWRTADGAFLVAYTDRPEALEAMGQRALDILRDNGLAATKGAGKLISQSDIALEGHPGRELKVEFPDGISTIRMYLVGKRVYQEIATIPKANMALEPKAIKILDSFKLLTEAAVEAELKRKIERATPAPLPQEPVARRLKSDAEDEGLKGGVKTVFTESEDLSGTWAVSKRKPSSKEYYNAQGNLTKRESYDYRGNPSDIVVYGYLDGDRASHFNSIDYEYNPPPMLIATAPGEAKPKYDSRYSYKFKFKYDEKGNLTEKVFYGNDGKLWLRYTYQYRGNQKEALVYAEDGTLNQKYLSTLDRQGNETEKIIYDAKTGAVREQYSYSYEFDAKGNWIKRTTSQMKTKDGKSQLEPYSVTYRTITYY